MQTKLQSIEFHNMKNTRRVKNYDNIDIVTGTTSWETRITQSIWSKN